MANPFISKNNFNIGTTQFISEDFSEIDFPSSVEVEADNGSGFHLQETSNTIGVVETRQPSALLVREGVADKGKIPERNETKRNALSEQELNELSEKLAKIFIKLDEDGDLKAAIAEAAKLSDTKTQVEVVFDYIVGETGMKFRPDIAKEYIIGGYLQALSDPSLSSDQVRGLVNALGSFGFKITPETGSQLLQQAALISPRRLLVVHDSLAKIAPGASCGPDSTVDLLKDSVEIAKVKFASEPHELMALKRDLDDRFGAHLADQLFDLESSILGAIIKDSDRQGVTLAARLEYIAEKFPEQLSDAIYGLSDRSGVEIDSGLLQYVYGYASGIHGDNLTVLLSLSDQVLFEFPDHEDSLADIPFAGLISKAEAKSRPSEHVASK